MSDRPERAPPLEPEVLRPGAGDEGRTGAPPSPAGPPGPPRRGCARTFTAVASVLVGGAYVANPTLGLFELLPDNLPLLGNLDEAAATTMLVLGLQYLFGRRRGD